MRTHTLKSFGSIATLAAALIISGCQLYNNDTAAVSPNNNAASTMATELVPNLPTTPYNYANIQLPAYLTVGGIQGQNNTPANNQITDHGATLGRVLFYDKKLSLNNTVACASCHKQENGFSDPNKFSIGIQWWTYRTKFYVAPECTLLP